MTIAFNKYQGTGNDFIIIDNRNRLFNPLDNKLVKHLCDRRFGIGADGLHEAVSEKGIIRLRMNDVTGHKLIDNHYYINNGSPHYVVFSKDVKAMDVYNTGKKLRWSDKFAPGGTNVNFAELTDNGIFVRTFERGVEDETLSCGTGVTASAIASVLSGPATFFFEGTIEV
jgi:diaminopimelate epimerase